MNAEEMKLRTKAFAVDCAKLILCLPFTEPNKVYKNQLIRCSSSVAANYRSSRRAKSKADFIHKLKIVEEELDESLFFLELLLEFNSGFSQQITSLHGEGEVLLRIIVATINSTRRN